MAQQTIGVIMNGVSGRMGYRQHLVRSILAIREQGGVLLATAAGCRSSRSWSAAARRSSRTGRAHGIDNYTTDLDAALADQRWQIYSTPW